MAGHTRHTLLLFVLASVSVVAFGQDEIAEPTARLESAADPAIDSARQPGQLTFSRRYLWAAKSSISPGRVAGNMITSAWSTASNEPEEYGPHWAGYGKRVGLRLASGATGTVMEASIGALWHEDPRYQRAAGQPLKARLAHVAKMTFLAQNRNGELMPAYARYISVPANSMLTNAWRPDTETDVRHTAVRIPMAFLNRAVGNLFIEFWPDATKWMHRD